MGSPPMTGGSFYHSLTLSLTAVGVAMGEWPSPMVGCLGTGGSGGMQSALTQSPSVWEVAVVMLALGEYGHGDAHLSNGDAGLYKESFPDGWREAI